MPRVQVIADDGWVALDECASGAQLASDHYRCLAERIGWAVEDVEARVDRPSAILEPVSAERAGRLAALAA